jgi:hypothetical protein
MWEESTLNVGQDTGYPEIFYSFSDFLQTYVMTLSFKYGRTSRVFNVYQT